MALPPLNLESSILINKHITLQKISIIKQRNAAPIILISLQSTLFLSHRILLLILTFYLPYSLTPPAVIP